MELPVVFAVAGEVNLLPKTSGVRKVNLTFRKSCLLLMLLNTISNGQLRRGEGCTIPQVCHRAQLEYGELVRASSGLVFREG